VERRVAGDLVVPPDLARLRVPAQQAGVYGARILAVAQPAPRAEFVLIGGRAYPLRALPA